MGVPLGGVGSPPITRQPASTTQQPNPVPVTAVANTTQTSITACCDGLAHCCDGITRCLTSVFDALSNWCSHCACSCECDSAASAHQRQQQPATATTSAMSELRRVYDDVMMQQQEIHQTAVTGGDGFDPLGDEAGAIGCAMSASGTSGDASEKSGGASEKSGGASEKSGDASGTSGNGAVTTQPQGGKKSPPSKIKFQDSPPREHKPLLYDELPPSYDEATGGGGASGGHHPPGPLGATVTLIEFSDSDDDSD